MLLRFCERHKPGKLCRTTGGDGKEMSSISDIAKKAGVSVSTVSHVVNGTRYVSPEKVEKVKKAIEELEQANQLPNFIVKKNQGSGIKNRSAVRTTGKKYILILLCEDGSLFQEQVRKKLEVLLREEGFVTISVCYGNDGNRLEMISALFTGAAAPSGVIAFPDNMGILKKEFFEPLAVPVVLIGNSIEDFDTDVLLPDTYEGGYKAVRHLVKNGHERIAFLTEAEELSAHRFAGYRTALEDLDVNVDDTLIFADLKTEERIFDAMRKITEPDTGATAIVVADSFTMIPVFRFLNARHIIVPRDISVVSLNEFDWASMLNPELTCIDKHPEKITQTAVEIVKKRIENGESAGQPGIPGGYVNMKFASDLNIRSSTAGIGRGPFGERAETADVLVLSEGEKEEIRSRNYTAAISFHYGGKAWMQLQEKGMRNVFDELGISVIAVNDAHFDPELQCRQLESLRFLKPDILISIPVDTSKTAEAFREVVESGIRLVLITNIPEGLKQTDYISCISVNEHSHGSLMGRGLGEYMQRMGMKYAGFFRHGAKDFYATRQRDSAAEQVLLEEFPEIHISGYLDFLSETEVYRKTLEFVKRYPETEAIYVSWDGPALKAIEALSDAGRSDIAVVTGDLDFAVAMNMARGGAVKMLSAQCPYEQGEAIALAAANGLLGKTVPSFIGVEPVGIHQENLLKNWRKIFREEPPVDLKNAVKQNS